MAVRDELHVWFAAQPPWQQDLARRLAGRTVLDGPDFEEALRVVKSAHGGLAEGETAPAPQPLALDDLPATATVGAPRLTSFGRLRGVGAVSAEHELRFVADGLTVIYGQNAVGKTTYVRALKRVCRAVDCETALHGNVFESSAQGTAPTAKVEMSVGGQLHGQQLDLLNAPALGLDAISVFDAQCAELYVDARNAVAFVPAALRVLARVAATQDQMRRRLEDEADELARDAPRFPEFTGDTAAQCLVAALSQWTPLNAARRLATLDEKEGARATELRAVLASADASSARPDAEAALQDAREADALATSLLGLGAGVEASAQEGLREAAEAAAAAEAAVQVVAGEFSGLPLAGVGGGPWRTLWQAAREFAEQAGAGFPPAASEPCPLCLQDMTADSAQRLADFENHVRSSVEAEARQARLALRVALDPLDARHVEACRTAFLASLSEREPAMHAAVERYLGAVSGRMATLKANPSGAQLMLPVLYEPGDALAAWSKKRREHAEALLAADDPKQEETLRAEMAELDARERLAARLPEVEKWVGTLKRVAAIGHARGALATNRITTAQRKFSEDVVTGALDAKLKEELDHLDCSHFPVDLHPETRVGETHVALKLAGAHGTPKVSEIASEGEQRALSLAFFLAEISTSESDGGIVVDDPVSSLDDERRIYIARRLVAETKHRQVIVFTHDLPFMLDLLDRAADADLEPLVQGLWRLGSEVGRVDDHPPFKAMKLRERVGKLDQEVAAWDKQDPARNADEAWERVSGFYSRLRTSWERAVEERLFRGVVTRFQREVKTKSLADVVVTPELVALVNDGMTRCSMFLHDEPQGASMALPGRARLAQDLEKLREFMALTKLK